MTPTKRMQEIQDSRKRLLEKQSSVLIRRLINKVADELHNKELNLTT